MNVIEIEAGNIIYPSKNDSFLTMFTLVSSSIGITLSAAALGLLFLTALLFAEWRQTYKNQLLIQFMAARFAYTFVRYFYDIRNILDWYMKYETTLYVDLFCMMYTETALVFWMYVFSKQMYDSLVKVFVVENAKLWKVSLVAWLVPGVVSTVTILLFHKKNENNFNVFFVYTIFAKWPVLITNAVLLILALKSILKNNKSKTENNVRIILVMVLLIFIFCFQQVLIDSYKIMYVLLLHQYTLSSQVLLSSNILSLYHCAFSIIFWVFGNANTRKMWRNIFKGCTVNGRPESRRLSSIF